MKKFINFVAMLMCVISFGVVLTACGEKPVSIALKEGTLDKELFVGESLNLDNVVLLVTYNSDEVKEVAKNEDMTFSNVDTSSEGQKTLTITYLDLTCEVTIIVTEQTAQPVSFEVVEGTLDTTVKVGEPVVLDNIQLRVTYDDESVQTISKNSDMTFSTVDTTTAGQKTLTITYRGISVNVTITVEENLPTYVVTSFEAPEIASLFVTNSQKFNLQDNTYKVGDDNAFVFKPIISGYTMEGGEMGDIEQLDYVPSTFKVEQKNGADYTELSGDNLTNTVVIDEQSYAFDFTDSAVGNTYKITISADTISGQKDVSFEFEIVDGYNIQSKAELSIIDNNAKTQDDWAELKTQNNVPSVNPNAVVIHGSYVLTDADVPSNYYYYKGDNDLGDRFDEVVGTLRNWKSIYTHDTPSGSTYTIYGNYNTIDASAIAITRCDIISANTSDDQKSGHSALFSFGGDNYDRPGTVQGNVVVDSLNLVGNANRSENELLVGGLLMVLTNSNDTLIKNVVASSWVTNMVAHANNGTWENSTHILECNFSDSFSNMFYYYGIKNNYIENSNLVGSGGPLLALTHVNPHEESSKWSNVEVKNSHLETWVNGTEAWFDINSASAAATQLLAMNRLFEETSQGAIGAGIPLQSAKTFQQDGRANFIGMIISNGNPLENSNPLKGKIVIKNADDEVVYTYDMESEGLKTIVNNSVSATSPQLAYGFPYFMAGNTYATVVGTDLEHITGLGEIPKKSFFDELPPSQETIQKLMQLFSGDYLGIYVNGLPSLGALVGYYNLETE